MKKLLTVFIILSLLLCGCQNSDTTPQPTPSPTEIATPTVVPSPTEITTPTATPTIKPVLTGDITPYYDFLKNFSITITEDFKYYSIFLKDLDSNGVQELCLYFPHERGGMNLKVYTRTTEVQELGELRFESGTTQLLYTDSYPGIIQFNLGGGRNWYSYITIIDGKLLSSYIWNEDYTGASESEGLNPIEEFTTDKQLILESGKAYENNQQISEFPLSELK